MRLMALFVAGLGLLLAGCMPTKVKPGEEFRVEIVMEAQDKSADEIFDAAQIWVAEAFRSAKQVIELADKEQGVLIGNGIVTFPGMFFTTETARFKMRIDVKDGRFRAAFDDVALDLGVHGWVPIEGSGRSSNVEPKARARFEELAASLAAHVSKQDTNW